VTDGRRVLPFAQRKKPAPPSPPADWLDAPSGLTIAVTVNAPSKDPDDVDAPPRPRSE
jgi:hypothetical protein